MILKDPDTKLLILVEDLLKWKYTQFEIEMKERIITSYSDLRNDLVRVKQGSKHKLERKITLKLQENLKLKQTQSQNIFKSIFSERIQKEKEEEDVQIGDSKFKVHPKFKLYIVFS